MQVQVEAPPRRLLGRYGYPASHRVIELVAMAAFIGFGWVFGVRVVSAVADRADGWTALRVVLALAAAVVVADLASGIVHALCDNLGSVDTPVLGQKFIRSFREHHVDPLDMTRGDFVRVNADNFLVCLPILVPAVFWLDVDRHLGLAVFLCGLFVLVVLTNQIHKWAHLDDQAPRPVRWLQRRGVILSPAHHAVHHTPPHDSHYCITTGLTNGVLAKIGFWPALIGTCRSIGRRLPGRASS